MQTILKTDPQNFVFYQNVSDESVMQEFSRLIRCEAEGSDCTDAYRKIVRGILQRDEKRYFAVTPWKDYLIRMMLKDNAVNRRLERREALTHEDYVLYEMELFSQMYQYDWDTLANRLEDPMNPLGRECYAADSPLSVALESGTPEEILTALTEMIDEQGLGVFAGAKLFRLNERGKPVACVPGQFKPFSEIVGYETQKEKILENTRALLNGQGAMNVLLYGDMGTGKSSMVKALTLEFKDTPLRFIEMHKGEFIHFRKLFERIRETNYPFIIFIDDLSFEEGDDDYKAMKNALEGSFEDIPQNLVIYATSNRRGLVAQTKSERTDAVNAREVLEEKMSLLSRFGLTIQFSAPMQEDYLNIVRSVASHHGLDPDAEGFREDALQYAIRHLNRSGRTAEQFVKSLLAKQAGDEDRVNDNVG